MKRFIILGSVLLLIMMLFTAADAKVLAKGSTVVKIGEDINAGEALNLKDLVAIKGNISVKGNVDGDVVAVLGSVHLFPTARISGDVVCIGGGIIRDAGALVGGDVVDIAIGKGGMEMADTMAPVVGLMAIGGFLVFKSLALLGLIALAVMVVSFFLKNIGVIASYAEKKWLKSLMWGVIYIALIVPIAVLLAVTVIGIPLILIEFVLISAAMIMGFIAVSQIIGKKITIAFRKPGQPMINEVIVGLIALFLVELIPFIGGIVKALACLIGFGSAAVTRLGTKNK